MQRLQVGFQLAYGVLSVLVIATAFVRGSTARRIQIAWVIALTLAGGLAPRAWGGGDSNLLVSSVALFGSLAVALIIRALLVFGIRHGSLDDRHALEGRRAGG